MEKEDELINNLGMLLIDIKSIYTCYNNEEENILKNIFSNYNKLLKIKYGSVKI
jgi:hypothetical protein